MSAALLDSLMERSASLGAAEPAWLADARRAAATALARGGLPNARNEAWKYTNLRALEQRRYASGDADATTRAVESDRLRLPGIDGPRLVFVNGTWRPDLSNVSACDGLSIATLAQATSAELESIRSLLDRKYADTADAFAQINTALATDGAIIRVAAGARVVEPLHLVLVGATTPDEIAWNLRLLVDLGENASLRLIEHHIGSGADGAAPLGNLLAQYALGANAKLGLLQIQDALDASTLIRRTEVDLDASAELAMQTVEAGAQLARHDLVVALAGTGARFTSRGVFALRGRQHIDTHLDVRHVARDTVSDIVWRGVADQRSRGVFHGAITVAAGADGADARLSNKNLLLSPNAEIDTQPVLEIHADEVKAAHGATVGQLDERALFYLRSRGLPADAARNLLIGAFCAAVLADIEPAALREHLESLLSSRLPRIVEE